MKNSVANLSKGTLQDDFFLPLSVAWRSFLIQVLLAFAFAVIIILVDMKKPEINWHFVLQAIITLQVFALLNSLMLFLFRPWLKTLELKKAMLACYILCMATNIVLCLFVVYLTKDWWYLPRILMVSAIVVAVILGYFYVQYRMRRELMRREQTELQARIQALQSRIRPHFLFNSMNIITSLISTDPKTAEEVVEDLSELFRASLNEVGNQVSVEEELALCRRYVHIESLRLGDRLRVNWNIGNIPAAVKIPLLTLQPILENAIYHGIQPLPEGGLIDVTVDYQKPNFYVRIVNPVCQNDRRRSTKGNRIALDNIRERLDALYGSSARLSAGVEDNHYITTLSYAYDV